MKTSLLPRVFAVASALLVIHVASAQETSPPISIADREAAYTEAIEKRTADILTALKIEDAAKSKKVTDVILAQYRILRTRDDAIDTMIKLMAVDEAAADKLRASYTQTLTPPVHANFVAKLGAELTPDQLDTVKDKMTYGKVKVTYDAYCDIIPALTEADKAKIMELLKRAREEAIDGGSAAEKSRIFQKYKDQINAYLDANGHNVAQSYKVWEAKQAKAESDKAAGK